MRFLFWSTIVWYQPGVDYDMGSPSLICHIIGIVLQCFHGYFPLMLKGERFGWLEFNLTCCIKVQINVKGVACWHCSVDIVVKQIEMLLFICMCDAFLVMDDW